MSQAVVLLEIEGTASIKVLGTGAAGPAFISIATLISTDVKFE